MLDQQSKIVDFKIVQFKIYFKYIIYITLI